MAGSLTIAELDAKIATLQDALDEMAPLPDAGKIGPDSWSGMDSAYKRTKERIDELKAERDALVNNDGCPIPARMNV